MPLRRSVKDENIIPTSDRPRLAHIDGFTIAKLILKWAGQVSPSECTRWRRGLGGHVKKAIWPVAADPVGFGFGGSVEHFSDRGAIPSKVTQNRIEETREEGERFVDTLPLGSEMFSVEFFSVDIAPLPCVGK